MPAQPTVLSHLAKSLSAHPEDIATEALCFILRESVVARKALAQFCESLGFAVGEDLRYETQGTNDEGTRPDMVGKNAGGHVELLVEAKFWASLTDAQPVGYLRILPPSGALLLFVAPAARFPALWPQLLRRTAEGGFAPNATVEHEAARCVKVGACALALCSWRALLEHLSSAVELAGESGRQGDIRQLAALCDQMDTDAFLPLRSEELTSTIGIRILQLGILASDIVDALVALQIADVKGLRTTANNGSYGRYVWLRQHGCAIFFSAERWARWGDSPLWLDIKGADWQHSESVAAALRAAGIPFRESRSSGCSVAIPLPAGVERDEVLRAATEHVRRVAVVLPLLNATSAPEPPASLQDTGAGDGAASA